MRTARIASMPWWSSPAGIACGFLLPLMFLIAWAGEVRHPALTIRGVQVLDLGWLMLGGLLLAALALGGAWLKGVVIIESFMALRDAPMWLRAAVHGWLALLCGGLCASFLYGG